MQIPIPAPNCVFLAHDSRDYLVGTSFNASEQRANDVVAFVIPRSSNSKPQAQLLDKFSAPPSRGYSGVTVDAANSIYLSADLGEGQPSFLRKFTSDLRLDPNFGRGGTLSTDKVRLQGLATAGDTIIAAVSWGRLLTLNSTGKFIGMSGGAASTNQIMIRDIAYVDSTQEVVGIDKDELYLFKGGTPASPAGYAPEKLLAGNGRQSSGSCVFYEPRTDRIYYNLNIEKKLISTPRVNPLKDPAAIVAAQPGGVIQPADCCISNDGQTMWATDLASPYLCRYRRKGSQAADIILAKRAAAGGLDAAEPASAGGAGSRPVSGEGSSYAPQAPPPMAAPTSRPGMERDDMPAAELPAPVEQQPLPRFPGSRGQ